MENRNNLAKTALVVTAGMGFFYIYARYRNQLWRKFQQLTNIGNPLKHRQIQVVDKLEQCATIINTLKKHCANCQVLGFDCEWVTVNGQRRPVALIQLSSNEGLCALFRLSCLQQVPKGLRELLENEHILKVGVAPHEDAQKLRHDYGVCTVSTFDVRYLAVLVGHKPDGIAGLAQSLLHVQLDKNWRLACSDWDDKELTAQQLVYAANDALVGIEVFKKLAKRYNANIKWKIDNVHITELINHLQPYFDRRFKAKFQQATVVGDNVGLKKTRQLNSDATFKMMHKRSMVTLKKPLYDNCLLLAPDGELLSNINRGKAQWYLDRNLAVEVPNTTNFTVRLNFQPSGRAADEDSNYYRLEKLNRCVVCGNAAAYLRKNIVPREYRKHFPLHIKDHKSHDVLLLCPHCHQKSNSNDLYLRMQLAQKCDAPLYGHDTTNKLIDVPELRMVKSAARALLHNSQRIPEKRRMELESILCAHYKLTNKEQLTDILQEATQIETTHENANYVEHGRKVVEHFSAEQNGIFELQKLWRAHFLSTMHPQYLPAMWNVSHNAQRDRNIN